MKMGMLDEVWERRVYDDFEVISFVIWTAIAAPPHPNLSSS
jgi:hypothetical protein